ncbi:GTP cyclohydrolase I FolE [soil metagenome]
MEHSAHHDGDEETAGESLGMEPLVREMLQRIGEDPSREGLLRTPARVDRAWAFLTSGYRANIEKIVNGALFTEEFARDFDDIVLVKNIEFYSLCEHHMIPFYGNIHVAYIPSQRIIGLSKIPRIVEVFSRRLQVQERMTHQIAHCLRDTLEPRGVAVVAEAKHLCMCMRGVQKQNSTTATTCMIGVFRENAEIRNELFQMLQMKGEC